MKDFNEAVQRYYEVKNPGKNDPTYIKYFTKCFGKKNINKLSKEDLANARAGIKKSPGTVNRYINFLRAVLNYCYEDLGWLDTKPTLKRVKESSKRVKFFTLEECARLHEALPEHLKPVFVFSLMTGVRMSNCLNLKWKDIQDGWVSIHTDETKNGRSLAVPLNKDAQELLNNIKQIGPYVFTYAGRKLTRTSNTGWYKALKKCGLEGFRWHDIRHTWATHHVQNGTPLHTLQHLGGWSDFNIVNRYAHLSKDYLNEACENTISLIS